MMMVRFHVLEDRTNQGALLVARARLHSCFRADTRLLFVVPSQLLRMPSDGEPRATVFGEGDNLSSFAGVPTMS
jgi:hypothetical protein